MSGLDSSDEEELGLMHHIQKGEHEWIYAGYDERDSQFYERFRCGYSGCTRIDYQVMDD